MKNIYRLLPCMLVMQLVMNCSMEIKAQNFRLHDINSSSDSHPSNNSLFVDDPAPYDYIYAKYEYAILKGVAYFKADDGIHGAELWRSNGTAAGTWLVKDVYPGPVSSQVRDVTVSGGKIYFIADDGINGLEVWVSDGSSNGTRMLKDVFLYGGSFPSYLTDVGGSLYFFASPYYPDASQLWKTDGTEAGTVLIADFNSPYYNFGNGARQICNVNGRVFFSLNSFPSGNELWTSDGTTAGTLLVKDINPFGNSDPSYLTALNGSLFFSADDGTGRKLWVSDGTDAGTKPAPNDNNIFIEGNTVLKFTTKGSSLYFSGFTGDGDGTEFCKYDASNPASQVERVKDIQPGAMNHNLYNITNVNGTLFFTVYNGTDQVLWKSDGTTAGTMQVKDINPGGLNIYLYKNFVNADGLLLFSFYDNAHGYEIWKSDGTSGGTQMIKEINKGIYSSAVSNITYLGGKLSLFEASDGKNGLELWKTDGTAAGTTMVKNINQSSTGSSNPYDLIPGPDNKQLLFVAFDPQYGIEMRTTGGPGSRDEVLKDIYKGSFNSYPYLLTKTDHSAYFLAGIEDPVPHPTSDPYLVFRLWKTDGTERRTSIVPCPALEDLISTHGYAEAGIGADRLLYMILFNTATYQQELWRSDGTGAGTFALKTDISPYYNVTTGVLNNKIFFTNYDDQHGQELWVSDGSLSGTKLTKDISPGPASSYPFSFVAYRGDMYFGAFDEFFTPYLWKSNGTESGTQIVTHKANAYNAIAPGPRGKLYFSGYTNETGIELWSTEGSDGSTRLVKDIYPDVNSSGPSNFILSGRWLYFQAYTDVYGSELWKTDGTAGGTQMVKDITPGFESTFLYNQVDAGDHLFFLINDMLWATDGTAGGTNLVHDANLDGVSRIGNLTACDDQLYFTGSSANKGAELYSGNIRDCFSRNSSDADSSLKIDMATAETTDASRTTVIYPNPVMNTLNVKIASSINSRVFLLISDVMGSPMLNKSADPGKGESFIQMDVSHLSSGVYFLKITCPGGCETVVKKFVKM